jgi:glycosyltransferase involved in cell wall biosynthesis
MVTSEFPPKWGGVGNGVHFQANVFAKMGYKIDIITRKQSKGMKIPPQHKNITVHQVPWLKLPMFFTTSFGAQAVLKIKELGNDFDVVHIHSNMTLIEKEAYYDIASPIVSTMHGSWLGERQELRLKNISMSLASVNDLAIMYISPFFDKYEDYAIRYSNAVTVDSISEMHAILSRGVKNLYGRIVRIPEGVDTEIFRPDKADPSVLLKYGASEKERVLICVARLAGRKGIDLLLKAFRKVVTAYPNVKLMIIGEGPQERRLKRLARELGLGDKTLFLGKVPFGDLEALYATADIFVFHSLWEGQGLVIEEAMASGTPCVSSKVGGVPEMVDHGVDGYYVEVGDIDGMARYIVKLLKDPELLVAMSKRGREKMVKHWSWYVIAKRYHKLYHEVMADAPVKLRD